MNCSRTVWRAPGRLRGTAARPVLIAGAMVSALAPVPTSPLDPGLLLADTEITAVSVYSDGAHVTRSAAIQATQGTLRVGFTNLPAGIALDALRVHTSAGIVRGVETDWLDEAPSDASETAALQAEIATLRGDETLLSSRLAGLRAELELLEKLQPRPGPAPLRPDLFLAGLETVLRRRDGAFSLLRKTERALEQTRTKLQRAAQRLELTGETAGSSRRRSIVVVALDLDRETALRIDLTYLARWATWRPHYELDLLPEERRVVCSRLADVWQTTAEDWRAVALKLSTSESVDGLWLPGVRPWAIEASRAVEDAAERLYRENARPPAGGDTFDDYAQQFEAEGEFAAVTCAGVMKLRPGTGGPKPEPDPASSSHSPTPLGGAAPSAPRHPPTDHPDFWALHRNPSPFHSAGGFNQEIDLGRPVTIASGHHHTRLTLGAAAHPIEIEYVLRPAVRATAQGRAIVMNPESVPLLAGPAAIRVGADFFGVTEIPNTPPRGTLTLELGAESAIQSTRRTRTAVKSAGLLSNDDLHVVEVSIDVVSHLPARTAVLLEDQIPVSRDENVKVTLLRVDPKQSAIDPKTGLVSTRLVLAPGEKRTVRFEYSVQMPRESTGRMNLEEAVPLARSDRRA